MSLAVVSTKRNTPVDRSAAADLRTIHGDRREEVVARAIEEIIGEHRAGGDRLHHRALHDALRELRVLDLFADRHAESLFDQATQIVGRCAHGDAREWHGRGPAVVARRERQAEHTRGRLSVVVEHLVEIAHPEEQDGIRMPGLDLAVLLHQRRGRTAAHRASVSATIAPMRCALSVATTATASARVA
jgi:hypothetical protein